MILVQNPLRQLNGNNLLIGIFFSLLLCNMGCGVGKTDLSSKNNQGEESSSTTTDGSEVITRSDPPVTDIPDPVGRDPKDINDQNPMEMDTVKWDLVEPLTPPEKFQESGGALTNRGKIANINNDKVIKGSYNVVIMLPFFTNKFAGSFGPIPKEARLAIQFYEGARMALRKLEMEGVPMNVSVLDTKADSNVVKSLLLRSEVQNADVIIGPVTKPNNMVLERFAREERVTVVSPLNPRQDFARQNPYFVQLNPSLETHFNKMLAFINKRHRNASNALIISPTGRSGETRKTYIQEAHKLANQNPNISPLRSVDFSLGEGATLDLSSELAIRDTTVVIIPSRDQGFVSFVLREVGLYREKNPVVVYGMPEWEFFEKVDFSYFENLNIHLTTDIFVDRQDDLVKDFKRNYYNSYGMVPGKLAYKGYDITLFVGRMLKENGVYFQNQERLANQNFLTTSFDLEPVFANEGEIEEGQGKIKQYENQYINFIEFRDYFFRRINRIR